MFSLNPVLAADTAHITTWDLSLVRLMKDQHYPWLVLVPARQDVTGIHQLTDADATALMGEIRRVSNILEHLYKPDRINVGALGNMVPQLHVHVIARFENDPAWPGPVWGAVAAKEYIEEDLQAAITTIRQGC